MPKYKINNPDDYFDLGCGRCKLHATLSCKVNAWREELSLLRDIINKSLLKEELKWMHPCYTLNGKNIILLHCFKEYCAIMFFKGSLLKDKHNLLIQQTENVQFGRQIRFSSLSEVVQLTNIIDEYIKEAIAVEESGLVVEKKKTEDFVVPYELINMFKTVEGLKSAFEALTPGRQRGYLLYFAAAKQSKTRIARIEKNISQIFAGIGWNEFQK